jgi:hypothetical protein
MSAKVGKTMHYFRTDVFNRKMTANRKSEPSTQLSS